MNLSIIKEEIKVIISDLDGTLLNNEHRISDYTKAVFQELHQQNYLIIVATGRHHLDAMPLVENLGIPLYLVTSNGARIHSPEKKLLFSMNMKSDIVQSMLSLDIDPEITIVLFREENCLINKENEKLKSFQKKSNYPSKLVNFKELDNYEAIKLFFSHEDQNKLLALRDLILEQHPDTFNHAFSLPFCLEFMDKAVDKSVAIAAILALENIDLRHSISFGDGFNDELMLNTTGKGLIMKNAPDALKNKLPHLEVIATNQENGVAKYLYEQVLETK